MPCLLITNMGLDPPSWPVPPPTCACPALPYPAGVTSEALLAGSPIQPTYVLPSVSHLLTIKDKLGYCTIC